MNMIAFIIELMKRELSFYRVSKEEKERVLKKIEEEMGCD